MQANRHYHFLGHLLILYIIVIVDNHCLRGSVDFTELHRVVKILEVEFLLGPLRDLRSQSVEPVSQKCMTIVASYFHLQSQLRTPQTVMLTGTV